MLGNWIYFDKNKKLLKNKGDKNISVDKEIKLCEKYNFDLSKQQLKKNSMKYHEITKMERVKEGQESIEFK